MAQADSIQPLAMTAEAKVTKCRSNPVPKGALIGGAVIDQPHRYPELARPGVAGTDARSTNPGKRIQ